MRITVVTPSFNQAAFIEAAILSVLKQNYPDTEYIIIDGGSTDGSVEIIRRYQTRLAYFCSEADQGQADALAKGFAKGTGQIYCWLNSDDFLLPGALHSVAAFFESNPDVVGVNGGAFLIDVDGTARKKLYGNCTLGVAPTYNRLRFYGQDGIYQQATFWRREAYEACGGINSDYEFIMDLDLFTRLAGYGRFGRIDRFLACFRIHDDSKTSRLENVRLKEMDQFRRIYQGRLFGSPWAWALFWFHRWRNRIRKVNIAFRLAFGLIRYGQHELGSWPIGEHI